MRLRIVAASLGSVALAACSSGRGLAPEGGAAGGGGAGGGAPGQTVITIRPTINRNVDVLFMLDNSSNMTINQQMLARAFSSYTGLLEALPGGLPNLHLGIVSSSLGAGRETTIDHCAPGGDQGILQARPADMTPGGPCTRAGLNPGQSFIANVDGQTNYTGDLADVFSCLALLGDGGCGFEHQLASVMRALGADGAAAPAQNAGFLRPDAYLQIVLLTDEDDCSAPPDSDLFDESSMTIASPLGPLQSYRCNEFGHLCNGKAPPRQPPGEVDLGTCVSNESGRLLPVGGIVTALKNLKADPSKVLVAAIAGPPTPYKVNVGPSQVRGDSSLWPYVEFSCTNMTANDVSTFGDPGVRIKQWVDAFGDNGVFESVCADSYAPALTHIAEQVGKAMGPPCLPAEVDATRCTFTDRVVDAQGQVTSTRLQQCADTADAGPCWRVATDASSCPTGQVLTTNRPGSVDASLTTVVTCPP
ncbi:MAG TPA: hypothetical protein VHL80_10865 [Polyangia bacterium]|nr:hypothetical protein [Polyangia bacterium]